MSTKKAGAKATPKAFDPKGQFWVSVLGAIFSLLLYAGVEIPNPEQLAGEVVTLVSSPTGYIGLIGLFITSLASPIWKFIKSGSKKFDLSEYLGSTNVIIALFSMVVAFLVYKGIQIPANATKDIVAAVAQKDISLILTLAVTYVLNPVVRWFKDRRKDLPELSPVE